MRIIDAEAIELKARKGIDEDGLLFIPYADVKESIDNTPTISQWIPVSERLPNDGEMVLLTFKGSKWEEMETAIYDYKYCFATTERYVELNEIIAWMPLPEPYKESDNE